MIFPVGYNYFFMLGSSVFYTCLLLQIDSSRHSLGSRTPVPTLPSAVPVDPTEDVDVRVERERMERADERQPLKAQQQQFAHQAHDAAAAPADVDVIAVRGLRKVFKKQAARGQQKVAVRNLNIGIPQGQW